MPLTHRHVLGHSRGGLLPAGTCSGSLCWMLLPGPSVAVSLGACMRSCSAVSGGGEPSLVHISLNVWEEDINAFKEARLQLRLFKVQHERAAAPLRRNPSRAQGPRGADGRAGRSSGVAIMLLLPPHTKAWLWRRRIWTSWNRTPFI